MAVDPPSYIYCDTIEAQDFVDFYGEFGLVNFLVLALAARCGGAKDVKRASGSERVSCDCQLVDLMLKMFAF